MRFRARFQFVPFLYVLACATAIDSAVSRVPVHLAQGKIGHIVLDVLAGLIWTSLGVQSFKQTFFNFWQVAPDGLRHLKAGKVVTIPFTSIAAIRPRTPKRGIEIEISLRGPEDYPHQYLKAFPSDTKAFLQAVQAQAPTKLQPTF